MKMLSFKDEFLTYIKAARPLLKIETVETERLIESLEGILQHFNENILPKSGADPSLKRRGLTLWVWDCIEGWNRRLPEGEEPTRVNDLLAALSFIQKKETPPGVFIMNNAHLIFEGTAVKHSTNYPKFLQTLISLYYDGKESYKYIVFNGGSFPFELQPYFSVMDFPLPDRDLIEKLVKERIDSIGIKATKDEVMEAASAVQGMTAMEIAGAVYLSATVTKGKSLDKSILFEEKSKIVKRSGLLEYIPTTETLETVGGLSNLKEWFTKISKAYRARKKAEEYCLPLPRGCLIAGVSGTGKSLSAKAIASLLGVPLYRCDTGKVFGGVVGDTERNTRELFKLIKAVSPAVVQLEEIEKAFAGLASSNYSDAGVKAGFVGSWLTYLQEKEDMSFVVMTANDITTLPPEFIRKGRIDEIWWVDLHTQAEREAIYTIHLTKRKRDPKKFDIYRLAKESDGMTGAEIEQCIKNAMFDAFFEEREFTMKDILKAISETVTIGRTKSEEIKALRDWAKGRARLANAPEGTTRKKKVEPVTHWND